MYVMRDPAKASVKIEPARTQRKIIHGLRRDIENQSIVLNVILWYIDIWQVALDDNVWDTFVVNKPTD